jgi:hypothetical protein
MRVHALLASGLAGLAVGCAPAVYGRVVSDVRVANGYISVDRCVLTQGAYHGIAVSDCHTENYYIGKSVVPIRSTQVEQTPR